MPPQPPRPLVRGGDRGDFGPKLAQSRRRVAELGSRSRTFALLRGSGKSPPHSQTFDASRSLQVIMR